MVACADPTDPTVVDELRGALGLDVRLAVATETAILEAIERYFGAGSTAVQKVIETMGEDERGEEAGGEDLSSLRDMAFDAPVVRLVNLLIENAIKAGASDVHIEPFEDTLRVRYRIDGVLFDAETPPKRLRAAVTSRIKIMAELNIAERRLPQDGRIRMSLEGRRLDIRVSTIPTLHGESVVMRILDRASILLPLDRLGFERADPAGRSSASSSCPTACSWSRGPPAPGRPRRSTPRSTRSTRPARRSSPSRTRSSTSSGASTRSTSSRRSGSRSPPASGTSSARTPT